MLQVDKVIVIRHKVLVEGLPQRATAREMGVDRKTVKRYLTRAAPVRVESKPRNRPVLKAVQPRIDELLEQWADRTTPKQRITAARVREQLLAEGFAVGYTTVRQVVAEWKRQRRELYVPLIWGPGEAAQVDFFEVTVELPAQEQPGGAGQTAAAPLAALVTPPGELGPTPPAAPAAVDHAGQAAASAAGAPADRSAAGSSAPWPPRPGQPPPVGDAPSPAAPPPTAAPPAAAASAADAPAADGFPLDPSPAAATAPQTGWPAGGATEMDPPVASALARGEPVSDSALVPSKAVRGSEAQGVWPIQEALFATGQPPASSFAASPPICPPAFLSPKHAAPASLPGERRKAWMFLMQFPHSNRSFAWLYDRADQVSFLDGHVRAFEHFQGVSARLIYDNLKAAVARLVLPERELTPRFLALRNHYLFEASFARPYEGHDKGSVEARGQGVRLRHLVPIPRGDSLEAISADLLARLDHEAATRRREDGRTIAAVFADEQARFLPLPAVPFEPRLLHVVPVSKGGLVQLEGATYSVPGHWKRLDIDAWVGPADIRFRCRGEQSISRRLPKGGRDIRYRHFLPELARKPQAVRQVISALLSELDGPFVALWPLLVDEHGPREAARRFARVLDRILTDGEAPVADAVAAALAAGQLDRLRLEPKRPADRPSGPATAPVIVPPLLARFEIAAARAKDYDRLLVPGDHETIH